MIGVINSILNQLKPVEKLMTEKTRIQIATMFMLSRLKYGLPQFLGESKKNQNRIHQTTMKLIRWCKGSYCFRISITAMCKSIKWQTQEQMILKQSANTILKIMMAQEPKQVFDQIRMPRSRIIAKTTTIYHPKTEIYKRTTIFQLVQLYNQLLKDLKGMNEKERTS